MTREAAREPRHLETIYDIDRHLPRPPPFPGKSSNRSNLVDFPRLWHTWLIAIRRQVEQEEEEEEEEEEGDGKWPADEAPAENATTAPSRVRRRSIDRLNGINGGHRRFLSFFASGVA